MRAAEYECASLQTRRVSRLQSQRQEAKSQECLLKRLCRTNQGQSRRICPVSISIRPHSRVDAKRVLSHAARSDELFCKRTGIAPEDLAAIRESQTRVLNDFSAARVVPCETGGKKLVASGAFPAGSVLFRFTGELSPVNIGDRSLQVGRAAHLLSVPPEEPWVYLQHSFEPTVSLIVDPVAPVATARTTEDLSDGAALTIDYTLHEWEMSGDGFVCSESGRRVRGFKHLTPSEREAALPRAAPHIREMAGE